jgi:small subunit ribosomal protein S7
MPRHKKSEFRRDVGVDPRYGSNLIQKFVNVVMECGKKSIAYDIVYDAIEELVKKAKGDKEKALAVFNRAFEQVMPIIEVRPRRVGGSVYQIPMEVNPDRARALAMRWIIGAARVRSDKTMGRRLAHELLDAYEGRGAAVKKRSDVHKMAESNRAFSHYAW